MYEYIYKYNLILDHKRILNLVQNLLLNYKFYEIMNLLILSV